MAIKDTKTGVLYVKYRDGGPSIGNWENAKGERVVVVPIAVYEQVLALLAS